MKRSRYLDTAALSQQAVWGGKGAAPSLVSFLERLLDRRGGAEREVVFAANATQALRTVIEGLLGGSSSAGRGSALVVDERVHPVVGRSVHFLGAVAGLRPKRINGGSRGKAGSAGAGAIVVIPVICWRTGRILYDRKGICGLRERMPASVVIADAVQCVGNIPSGLLGDLLDSRDVDVVLGGLHKWLGSRRPLGVAWVQCSLLKRLPELVDWLCLNDCLGNAAGRRRVMRSFPDTYDANLAEEIAHKLHKRFPTSTSVERHFRTLQTNAEVLRELFGGLKDCVLLNPSGSGMPVTGIVGVGGPVDLLRDISKRLARAGFKHSLIAGGVDHGRESERVLRISAPTERLRGADRAALGRALKPFRREE